MSDKTDTKAFTAPLFKMADAQMTQMNAMFEEMAKAQASGLEQAKTALDESARLAKETLGYWTTLATESRRVTLDTMKRTMDLFSAQAS